MMQSLIHWLFAGLLILVGFPELNFVSSAGENFPLVDEETYAQAVPYGTSTMTIGIDSAASDAVQNKAFVNLQIVDDVAYVEAGFAHPDSLAEDVRIEWRLFAWNAGSTELFSLTGINQQTEIGYVEVNTQVQLPQESFDYYQLESKNKVRNEEGLFTQLFVSSSRWSRIAPFNGIRERTGEVTSYSAVLHTYLSEKPAFNATTEINLAVPPMAGYAQFKVFSDASLQNKVSESGFHPVDDYIQAGTEWYRINYNFRWTVTGLIPDTTYYYIVETKSSDGADIRQAMNVNSFKTSPLKEANDPITFVVAHCFDISHTAYPDDPQYEDLGLKIFASMLSDPPPDFVIMQGDTVFYDGGYGYAPNVGTVDKYTKRWLFWYAQYQFTNFMNFFQLVPGYWQVDDHDYWLNNVNEYMPDGWDIFRNVNPTPGEYGTVGENGASYYNDNPYLTSSGDGNEYWRSIRWGQHLEIFLEEGRNLRDYDAGLIWGTEQREWLEQHIRESDATFKIISATTPLIGPVVPDSMYPAVVPDKHASDHFRAETELFLNNIRDVTNVYLVVGDRHYKYHSMVNSTNFPALSSFHEFSSGAGAAPPHASTGGVPDSDLATMIFSDAEVGASAGYLRVEIVPLQEGAQITFKLIRVTEELDNDVVHQYTFTALFNEPESFHIYLPLITKLD